MALTNWHPSDRSAKLMLKPWQRALPDGSFIAFLIKHIVPKLQLCMQSLVINPHQQHLGEFVASFTEIVRSRVFRYSFFVECGKLQKGNY